MKLEPFPYSENPEVMPTDGFLEKKFRFCELNFNAKCIAHYKSVSEKEGSYTCPYGFSTVVKTLNTKKKIFTSIELERATERRQIKKNKSKKDNKKRFTASDLESLFEWYTNIDSNINAKKNILREYDMHSSKVSQKEEVLDDTLHELRKLNNALKKQAFMLKAHVAKGSFDKYELDQRSKNIFSTSQLITARLNAYDFTLNPSGIESNPKTKLNLYKKFEKASHCLELIMNERNISISFIGTCHCLNEFYEIIDILPFIVFENAIKYSPDNSIINCTFIVSNNQLTSIKVTNKGYLPTKVEIPSLFNKTFRGASAKDISGSGKGLFTAKMICDFNNVDLSVSTIEERQIDGRPYGEFIVTLKIAAANSA